jgi:hypothetical protein
MLQNLKLMHCHSLMELSPSWEAANCAATQELPSILWNLKIHYCTHKSPPLVPFLSQIDPVHTIPSYLSKIHFNIVHPPCLRLPSGLFLSGFPINILYAFLLSPIRAACPAFVSERSPNVWLWITRVAENILLNKCRIKLSLSLLWY